MADLKNLGNSSPSKADSAVDAAVQSLWVNEEGLRKAGVRSYYVEVKSRSQNEWNVLYQKKVDLADQKNLK